MTMTSPEPHWLDARDALAIHDRQIAEHGGIAGVRDIGDSFESHIADTVDAGAELNDLAATRAVVEGAPKAIDWLVALGVPFTEENGQLHLRAAWGDVAQKGRLLHAEGQIALASHLNALATAEALGTQVAANLLAQGASKGVKHPE